MRTFRSAYCAPAVEEYSYRAEHGFQDSLESVDFEYYKWNMGPLALEEIEKL